MTTQQRDQIRFALLMGSVALLPFLDRPVAAHDIWLHADSYRLEKGDTLVVRQLVGAELSTDLSRPERARELPILRDLTPKFALVTDQGSIDLLAELQNQRARAEVKPVLSRALDFEGLALVAMEHSLIYTEHTNDEFLDYLEHEGLARERFEPKMGTRSIQTEAYLRTLKSLVRVGSTEMTPSEIHSRVLGQPIEMILLQNPYRLDPGDDLDVRVLLHGRPLAGQVVKAYSSDGSGPASVYRERTNSDGVARFSLSAPGVWLLRLVHLTLCSPRSGTSNVDCEDAAWEGYWTAYSFELD